ncbi:MAG: MFS transporter, partial [Promethearchaeota archaeon]
MEIVITKNNKSKDAYNELNAPSESAEVLTTDNPLIYTEEQPKAIENLFQQKPVENKKGLFWLISIFSSSSQNFYQQFFSAFARIIGVSASVLGFLVSVRNLLTGLFQGTAGRLSDEFGRRYILIAGFFISFIIAIPLIFFENTILLIFVALIQAFSASIIIPTWNAVLGDVTEPRFRAAFIGRIASIGRIISVAFTLLVALFFFLADEVFNGWVIWGWPVNIPWRVQ